MSLSEYNHKDEITFTHATYKACHTVLAGEIFLSPSPPSALLHLSSILTPLSFLRTKLQNFNIAKLNVVVPDKFELHDI